jgi:DNA adenine methylase
MLRQLSPKNFDRYIEPFCGSLCLFVSLKPRAALVGDINEDLIHFYRQLRVRPIHVSELAHGIPTDEESYYQVRAIDSALLTSAQRAARFLYLNRFCFNGVYRTNREGGFNVARGKHMGAIPPIEELVAFGGLLRRARLRTADFSELLCEAGRGDFVYLDPPYVGRGVRNRGEYGVGAFNEDDLKRLRDSVDAAAQRGAKVLVSYADLPKVRKMFRGWNVSRIEVERNVSGFANGRARVTELMLRNFS